MQRGSGACYAARHFTSLLNRLINIYKSFFRARERVRLRVCWAITTAQIYRANGDSREYAQACTRGHARDRACVHAFTGGNSITRRIERIPWGARKVVDVVNFHRVRDRSYLPGVSDNTPARGTFMRARARALCTSKP